MKLFLLFAGLAAVMAQDCTDKTKNDCNGTSGCYYNKDVCVLDAGCGSATFSKGQCNLKTNLSGGPCGYDGATCVERTCDHSGGSKDWCQAFNKKDEAQRVGPQCFFSSGKCWNWSADTMSLDQLIEGTAPNANAPDDGTDPCPALTSEGERRCNRVKKCKFDNDTCRRKTCNDYATGNQYKCTFKAKKHAKLDCVVDLSVTDGCKSGLYTDDEWNTPECTNFNKRAVCNLITNEAGENRCRWRGGACEAIIPGCAGYSRGACKAAQAEGCWWLSPRAGQRCVDNTVASCTILDTLHQCKNGVQKYKTFFSLPECHWNRSTSQCVASGDIVCTTLTGRGHCEEHAGCAWIDRTPDTDSSCVADSHADAVAQATARLGANDFCLGFSDERKKCAVWDQCAWSFYDGGLCYRDPSFIP